MMRSYPRFLPYSVAIGSTAIALLLSLWLEPLLSRTIGAFFYIGVIVSTWYGGLRPGMVAIILSTVAIESLLMPTIHQLRIEQPENVLRLGIFLMVALTINLLTSNLQHSKQKIQQLSQQLAQENAEQLRMALSAAQMGMWDWNIVTGEIKWSPEHEELFGLAVGTFDGRYKTFDERLHPDDRPALTQAVNQALQTHSIYQHEYRIIWADGSIHWVEGVGQAFDNEAGEPVRMTGTIMAIDDRKQAQITLEQQFAQQRLVMDMTVRIRRSLNLPEILQTTVDEVRQFLLCDRVTILQFSPDWSGTVVVESVGANWTAILSSQIDDPCFSKKYVEAFKAGLVTAKSDIYTAGIGCCHLELLAKFQVRANLVVPILHRDELWGLLIAHHCEAPREWQTREIDLLRQLATQVSIAIQQADLFAQVQNELTERKRVEAALRESQIQLQRQLAQIETIYQSAPIGLNVLDTDLRFVRINQRLAEMNGFSVQAHIGRTVSELLPDLADTVEKLLRPILETGKPLLNVEISGETPAQPGVQRIWLESFLPLKDGDHRIIGISTVCEEITERKQAEQTLAKQALRIKTLFNTSFDGIVILDLPGNVIDANPRFAEMLGYTIEEALKLKIFDWDAEFTPEELWQLMSDYISLKSGVVETRHRRKDGSIYDVEISVSVVEWEGKILLFCACRDISERQAALRERKQAEIALQQLNAELEQRVAQRTAQLAEVNDRLLETVIEQQQTQLILLEQSQLLDLAHDTIMTLDLHQRITFWNEGAEKMYGFAQAEALGQISDILLKTQFPQPRAEIEAELLEKGYWEGEIIHFRRDAQPITVASRWVLQKDNAGKPIKILEINNDITERKQAEFALSQSEERRRLALDLTHIAFWDWHVPSKELIWNDNHFTLLGLTPYSIEPSYEVWRNAVHREDIGWVEQQFLASIETHSDYTAEYRVVYPDGSVHWLMGRSRAIYDESGKAMRSLGVLLDISDRKNIEDALRQSEEKFRQLADNIQAVFWMRDIQSQQILYVSKAYETIWQRSCQNAYQNFSNWLDAIHPDDRQLVDLAFTEQLRTGQSDTKYRIIRPDGSICWIRDRAFPIKNELREITRIAGISEDITELQKVEQMKSEFIGIVSHELRTPLTAIRAALGLLNTGIYDNRPDKFKRMIEIAATDCDRLVRLVNDILDLERLESGRAVLDKTTCQAADLIQQAVEGVKAIAKQQNINFNTHLTDAQVWADADAIIQTLTNLLSNALKFSPSDSTITLSVQPQTDCVLFQIRDRGRGIPADKLEVIFGRFQQVDASDSRDKGGTGLGLAICHSIIDQHNGKIWAESTLGVGSTFFFTLPVSRG